ncbi:MAG: sulfatase-like hydrolase/transferase [Sphingobacteriales bacterium]|nr:sulfatase-like hydrolase/transferase [Sphingobacteriales bacterium]
MMKIPRIIKWVSLLFLLLIALMTILRLLFFYYYNPQHLSFFPNTDAFWLGIRFDARIVSIILLPLLLLGSIEFKKKFTEISPLRKLFTFLICFVPIAAILIINLNAGFGIKTIEQIGIAFAISMVLMLILQLQVLNPFVSVKAKRFWFWYLGIAVTVWTLFYGFDFAHYSYLSQRLNASVLNFLEDAGISFNMMWQSYPIVKILLALIIAVVLLMWIVKRFYKTAAKENVSTIFGRTISFTVLFFIMIVGIFGRIGQYPLRWSDAFALGNDYKANLSLNPFQSFFSSLTFRHATYDRKKVAEYYPLMTEYLGIKNPNAEALNFARNYTYSKDSFPTRPNIVLVICESFSAYKSSMWGNPLNTTPYFNELCKEGIFFDHCFTPHFGTARGVWAVITGTPDVQLNKTVSRNPAAVDQHTIINNLEGYEKFYFLGGSTSWANIRGVLTNNIKGLNLYEGENFDAKKVDVWGISDKNLFLEANKRLAKQNKPFFAIIQTADNHRPYTIPEEDLNAFKKIENVSEDFLKKHGFESLAEYNAFRYTDFSYQQFMEAAKKEKYFSNTIFIFVGDHGIRGNAADMFPKSWTEEGLTSEHVPLLFYAPQLLQPQRINQVCSQVDILPSVAGLLHQSYYDNTLGRNLFDSSFKTKDFAFIIDHDERQIGVVSGDYYFVHQLNSSKEKLVSIKNNEPVPVNGSTDSIRGRLSALTQAAYETARYMLYNNKKKENK